MFLTVPELKVMEHNEPLLLIGTDVLTEGGGDEQFFMIGIHPTSYNGVIGLKNNTTGQYKMVELASRPRRMDKHGNRILTKGSLVLHAKEK